MSKKYVLNAWEGDYVEQVFESTNIDDVFIYIDSNSVDEYDIVVVVLDDEGNEIDEKAYN